MEEIMNAVVILPKDYKFSDGNVRDDIIHAYPGINDVCVVRDPNHGKYPTVTIVGRTYEADVTLGCRNLSGMSAI
jgi:hypothetical protein